MVLCTAVLFLQYEGNALTKLHCHSTVVYLRNDFSRLLWFFVCVSGLQSVCSFELSVDLTVLSFQPDLCLHSASSLDLKFFKVEFSANPNLFIFSPGCSAAVLSHTWRHAFVVVGCLPQTVPAGVPHPLLSHTFPGVFSYGRMASPYHALGCSAPFRQPHLRFGIFRCSDGLLKPDPVCAPPSLLTHSFAAVLFYGEMATSCSSPLSLPDCHRGL